MSTTPCDDSAPAAAPTVSAATPESRAGKSTYGQILKSTSLIGAASLVNLAIGVIRAKAVALILGPAGVGLNGLYTSITTLAENIAGMGITSSGVRQIAKAAASGDDIRVAKTAAVLRKTSLALGVIGASLLIVFSQQISTATFGNRGQAGAICILAVSVLLRLVSAGQGALLQGLRRINDLAKAGVLGTLLGMLATIFLVYLLRERGIVASFVAGTTISLAISYWYSRRAKIERVSVTSREVRAEAKSLLHLGSVLMVSSLAMMGSAYIIRASIQRALGLEATGLYQSAWSLGGLYVGFILQSMGADFYPRLTSVIHDHDECNRLVNEQAHISLLLAGAGIIGTLTFAFLVIKVFYTSRFAPAEYILRWICLGSALQVLSWPMGFIILAKGEKAALMWTELSWAAVHVGLALVGLRYFGLVGAGFAFFGAYVFHTAVVSVLSYRLTGFRWSAENRNAITIYLLLIGSVLCGLYTLPKPWALLLGAIAMTGYGYYSVSTVLTLVPLSQLPGPVGRLIGQWQKVRHNAF
jgi:PST family polysaccharide transporter